MVQQCRCESGGGILQDLADGWPRVFALRSALLRGSRADHTGDVGRTQAGAVYERAYRVEPRAGFDKKPR